MVKMDAIYKGKLKVQLTHMSGGPDLLTSAPLDNGGTGVGFSPTDLLGASLVSCILTTMALKAKSMGVPFDEASGSVEKHMVADPTRRVGRLVVKINLPEGLSVDQRQAFEHAGRHCPVAHSLSERISAEISFS
jgi:uncharacterized OsmC-like protein